MPKLKYRTKMPRPDDPEILESIYNDLKRGMPLKHAAIRAGISEWTAYGWVDDAKAALAQGEQYEGELGSVVHFGQVVKEAHAACVDAELTTWDAGGKDWVKSATKLERRFPQDFGRNQRIEQTTNVTVTHRLELASAPEQELLAIVQNALQSDVPLLPAPSHGEESVPPSSPESKPTASQD